MWESKQQSLLMDIRGGYNQLLIWCHHLQHHPSLITMHISPVACHSNQFLNWNSSSISLLKFFLLKHYYMCSIYRGSEGSFTINDFIIIGKTCYQSQRYQMDTWIQILTHVNSYRRHWPSGDSGTMRISLPMWTTHPWVSRSAFQTTLEWDYMHLQCT